MDLIHGLFLGLLQGVTEFLPISSSAHLILAEYYLEVKAAGLTLDVILHLGTLTAILGYFRHDFRGLLLALRRNSTNDESQQRILGLYLCWATLPGVLFGVAVGKYAESTLRSPTLIAITLSLAGALLWWAEKVGRRERSLAEISCRDAMLIGCAQAMAIIPGVSRSGATITAGLLLGLDRTASARFSFLLSAPILLGAGCYKVLELFGGPGLETGQLSFFLAGFLAAAVSGYGVIAFLMKFVQTRSLAVFAYYRFGLAALVVWVMIK
jgi:undecaprenyl-diphosphatase